MRGRSRKEPVTLWSIGAVVGSLVVSPSCQNNDATPSTTTQTSATGEPDQRIGGTLILATTTSTRDSGLLDVLVPLFEKQTGVSVKVIAVGTGAALRMAAKGDADAVLVHAPEAEQAYVKSGDLVEGRHVMHNDFVLLGPAADPVGAKAAKNLDEALAAVAERGVFVSRGDDSGTHKKELALWSSSAVSLQTIKRREETGQGMGATLHIADERQAYTLSDRATYLAHRTRLKLQVVAEGDPRLINDYHVYVVSPGKHDGVKAAQARAWVAFLTSAEVQARIAGFGKADFGESLFVPDGAKPADAGAPLAPHPKPAPSTALSGTPSGS